MKTHSAGISDDLNKVQVKTRNHIGDEIIIPIRGKRTSDFHHDKINSAGVAVSDNDNKVQVMHRQLKNDKIVIPYGGKVTSFKYEDPRKKSREDLTVPIVDKLHIVTT